MTWSRPTFAPGQQGFAANLNDVTDQVAVLREASLNPEYPEFADLADGDDWQPAIQAAVDAGPTLLTTARQINSAIELGDGARLSAEGAGSLTLVADSDTHGIVNADQVDGNTDIEVRGVVVVGPEDGTLATAPGVKTGRGIYFSHVTNARALDCDVSRFGLQGICFEVVTGGRIAGSKVTAIKEGNAISLDAGTVDVVVIGNPRLSCADCAIGVHHKSDRIAVVGNTVENTVFGRGIDWYGALGGTIVGNVLKNVGGTGTAGHGILVYPSDPSIADEYEGTPAGLAIEGNTIIGANNDGIQVLGNQATAITDLSIRGGVIVSPGGVGVRLARKVSRASIATHIYGAGSDGVLLEVASGDIPATISVNGLLATGCTGYGLRANSGVVGVFGSARLRGNTAGSISVPLSNNVLYDTADGYVQLDSGLTVRDLYATSLSLALAGVPFATTAATVSSGSIFADSADSNKLKFKDFSGATQALY